jgi:hypothetical protein
MFDNERDFQKIVSGLKIDTSPNPAHRERLRRQMLRTFEETAGTAGRKISNFRFQISNLNRLAVAAVILIAVTVAAWRWLGPAGPMTFTQVRVATQKMPWMHAVIKGMQNGKTYTGEHWYNFAADRTYVITDDGGVRGWEYGPGQKTFVYSPRVKTLLISGLTPTGPFGVNSAYNLVDAFAVFAAKDDAQVSRWTAEHEGKTVRAFGVETAGRGFDAAGRQAAKLKIAIMADPATKRAVAADIEYQGADSSTLAREQWVIDYPQSGPDNVFALGVPGNARVIDRTRQMIGTPGDEPVAVPTPAPGGSSKQATLEIKLPKPMFVGTPQDNRTPYLEQPRGRPRPPFLAPVGTRNVALGKPVSSSDHDPVYGSLDLITDGDKEADDGSFIELGPKPQYVTIDLQERCEIFAIVVWHYHRLPRVYFDVVVQVSDDRSFRSGVQTIFNNDRDNSLGLRAGTDLHYTETNEGKLIDSKGVQGRYVRLWSNGNTSDDLNHYIEVEVYGRPIRLIKDN